MRLLNSNSLRLESFEGEVKPQYAILSHTWGKEEVLFEDVENRENLNWQCKSGFTKVQGSCRQASLDGYDYIWIDTCCINKSSSAELSEAINSMYKWYESSSICYAFLEDVLDLASFPRSRWLTRGWTLQELIAPKTVRFYNINWQFLGDRLGLAPRISHATKIGIDVLTRGHIINGQPQETHMTLCLAHCPSCGIYGRPFESILETFCVAQKMTWASNRKTTREEDLAYCLLGLFQINMTLLYGEGPQAFRRLQEEIVKRWNDQSILVWCLAPSEYHYSLFDRSRRPASTFANHPKNFTLDSPYYVRKRWTPKLDVDNMATIDRMEIACGRLVLTVLVCPIPTKSDGEDRQIAILDCVMGGDLKSRPVLQLKALPGYETIYRRVLGYRVCIIEPSGYICTTSNQWHTWGVKTFYEGPVDLKQAKMERISIVEDVPDANPFGYSHYQLQSRITQFSQLDTDAFHYRIMESFPKWIDENAHTLPPSPAYVVAFEGRSSVFFVLWCQYPVQCTIMSLQEVYNRTLFGPNRPTGGCTVENVLQSLRHSYNLSVNFGDYALIRCQTSRLLGLPGPGQRILSINVNEGADFLDTRVIEVEVDISIPKEGSRWSMALEAEPILPGIDA
ncbi:HET-domain-containing protein [Hypoxylon cercidicola]|nr:HET-domain-containing protein [Hypoxylon cercidicola]